MRTGASAIILLLVFSFFVGADEPARTKVEISRAAKSGELVRIDVWNEGALVDAETVEIVEDTPSITIRAPFVEGSILVLEGPAFIAITDRIEAAHADQTVVPRVFDKAVVSFVPEVDRGRVPKRIDLELVECWRPRLPNVLVVPLNVDPERLRVDAAVPADCFDVSLGASGFSSVDLGRRELGKGERLDLGTIRLTHGAKISVRVVDRDGTPVANVQLIARSAAELGFSRSTAARTTPRARARGTTNDEGRAVLEDVSPGRIAFEMKAEGRKQPAWSPQFDVELGRDLVIDPLELPDPGSAAISVSLPDSTTDHLEIFGVMLAPMMGGALPPTQMITEPIGSDGIARFEDIPAGKWHALISGRIRDGMAFGVGDTEIEIHTGHETLASVAFDAVVVEGRIEKGGRLHEADGLLDLRSREPGHRPHATVRGGRFVALMKEGVRYMPWIDLRGARSFLLPTFVEAPASGDLVIALPDGTIEGRVRDASGAPVPKVSVAALGEVEHDMRSRPTVVGRTNERGEFVLDMVAPGRWTLHASPDSGKAEPVPVELRDGEHKSGIEIVVRDKHVAPGRLTGKVQQVHDARLAVTFLDGASRGRTYSSIRADADGAFEVPLAEGDEGALANVMVAAADLTMHCTRVRLEDGLIVSLPAANGSLVIRRPEGSWRSDSRFPVLVAPDNSSMSAYLSGSPDPGDGTALYIPGIAPGTWRIVEARTDDEHATVRQGRADLLPVAATVHVIEGRTIEVLLGP